MFIILPQPLFYSSIEREADNFSMCVYVFLLLTKSHEIIWNHIRLYEIVWNGFIQKEQKNLHLSHHHHKPDCKLLNLDNS